MPSESEKKKRCFVIGPIGDEASDTRKRSDQLLKYVIEPVAQEHGYEVDRADKLAKPGIITNQIIESIVEADLVVADLTEKNPNVFYELAIRHGLQKPFIHIIDSSEKIPFDIAGVRAIQINIHDLDSVYNAKKEMSDHVKNIEDGKMPIDNPISVSFDMQKLRESGKPSDRIQADIVQSQAEMQASIRRLEKQFELVFGKRDARSELERKRRREEEYMMERERLMRYREELMSMIGNVPNKEREHMKNTLMNLEHELDFLSRREKDDR